MAVKTELISLDFPTVLTGSSTTSFSLAQALTLWIVLSVHLSAPQITPKMVSSKKYIHLSETHFPSDYGKASKPLQQQSFVSRGNPVQGCASLGC